VPSKRKLGAAKRLLLLQEQLVKERSFKHIKVKSMNRFRPMLKVLISNDYDITEVENYGHDEAERICFKKSL
jgi:hypothetical protein